VTVLQVLSNFNYFILGFVLSFTHALLTAGDLRAVKGPLCVGRAHMLPCLRLAQLSSPYGANRPPVGKSRRPQVGPGLWLAQRRNYVPVCPVGARAGLP
jgi:hypothetical protein